MVLEQAQVQNLAQVTSLGDKHVHPCSLIKIYAKTAYTDQTVHLYRLTSTFLMPVAYKVFFNFMGLVYYAASLGIIKVKPLYDTLNIPASKCIQ